MDLFEQQDSTNVEAASAMHIISNPKFSQSSYDNKWVQDYITLVVQFSIITFSSFDQFYRGAR